MKNKLISIIMPAYNSEKYIEKAISSVIGQTYTNWELIINNDGSKDKTEEIILSFPGNQIYYYTQTNQGVSAARNLALSKMKGDYFCFLDADDFLPKKSLAHRLEVFEKNKELEFVGGGCLQASPDLTEKLLVQTPNFRGYPKKEVGLLNSACYINCCNWLIKNDRNRSYSFPIGWTNSEDLAFCYSIADQGKIDFTEEIIYWYRRIPNSASQNMEGFEKGYKSFLMLIREDGFLSRLSILKTKLKIMRIMTLSHLFISKNVIKSAKSFIYWIFA